MVIFLWGTDNRHPLVYQLVCLFFFSLKSYSILYFVQYHHIILDANGRCGMGGCARDGFKNDYKLLNVKALKFSSRNEIRIF